MLIPMVMVIVTAMRLLEALIQMMKTVRVRYLLPSYTWTLRMVRLIQVNKVMTETSAVLLPLIQKVQKADQLHSRLATSTEVTSIFQVLICQGSFRILKEKIVIPSQRGLNQVT